MDMKHYKTIDKLIYDVVDIYSEVKNKTNKEDFAGINIVAHYDIILETLNNLVKNTDFEMKFIEITDPDWDNYCNEFILTINNNGHIYCQKAIYDGQKDYITVDGFTFVSSDTNSKFVVKNKDIPMIEFSINGDGYESDHEKHSDPNGCVSDFQIMVNLDMDEAFVKLDEIETRMERICNMVSEMDSFRKLFNW